MPRDSQFLGVCL